MAMDETAGTNQTERILLQDLVSRFPMSCVCFQPVFSNKDKKDIENFIVLYTNARFEKTLHIPENSVALKSAADVFNPIGGRCIKQLMKMAKGAFCSPDKSCFANVSIYGHIYKASALFIMDAYLFCFLEDIHTRYFHKYFHRYIPRDIITTIIAENNAATQARETLCDEPDVRSCENQAIHFPEKRKPVELLHAAADFDEPDDAVFRDSLTGLYDRCFAMEALRIYLDHQAFPLSVVLGDVNGLKTINENMGYYEGDEILIKIANLLNTKCRTGDIVARWNDGGFIMLLPYVSREDTQYIIKRLEHKLHKVCGEDYHIVTFGYATCYQSTRTAEDLIREAEKWIYRKKLLIDQSHRSSIIRLLLSMLHAKSAETEEHSNRMADHCQWLAKQLGLSDEMLDDLILLSMLHDIGKVGIPDDILNKPDFLTDQEREIINRHPEIGSRITETVPELRQVATYILSHHEWWDGTGYPKALRGEDIPIASRIIAMVDAYDVMITGRKYQKALTREEAIAELRRCAGTQFDPHIVSVYVKLLSENYTI